MRASTASRWFYHLVAFGLLAAKSIKFINYLLVALELYRITSVTRMWAIPATSPLAISSLNSPTSWLIFFSANEQYLFYYCTCANKHILNCYPHTIVQFAPRDAPFLTKVFRYSCFLLMAERGLYTLVKTMLGPQKTSFSKATLS